MFGSNDIAAGHVDCPCCGACVGTDDIHAYPPLCDMCERTGCDQEGGEPMYPCNGPWEQSSDDPVVVRRNERETIVAWLTEVVSPQSYGHPLVAVIAEQIKNGAHMLPRGPDRYEVWAQTNDRDAECIESCVLESEAYKLASEYDRAFAPAGRCRVWVTDTWNPNPEEEAEVTDCDLHAPLGSESRW